VLEALERILRSSGFQNSARRAQLLRYLVERTLAGEGDAISEYGIGVDVFGKPPSFDPRLESIVRTEFSRLRQKLADYYAAGGRADPVVIAFPPRTYVPAFTIAAGPPPAAPRRFYRSGAVAAAAVLIACAGAWLLRPAPARPAALVVLPFANLSPDRADDYLADGITEELTNQLAQSKDLSVVARTSASLFKGKAVDIREVGRKLGVGAALEGSIAPENGRIRITAQLNRTSDGYHLWSRAYETSSGDLLTAERDIARSVVSAATGIPPVDTGTNDGTRDPEAHDLYLRAYHLALGAPPDYPGSLALFRQALARDPAYVNAYVGIARVEIALVHMTAEPPDEAIPRARAALETALHHDPSSGEARGVLANVIAIYDWDWPRAEREFRRAIADGAQSTTRSLYGSLLATRGRFREAQAQLRLAEDADPLGMGPRFNQFLAFYLEHDYAAATRVLRGMLDLRPDQFDARFMLGTLAFAEHDCAGARREYEWAAQHLAAPVTQVGLALAAACSGDRAEALARIRQAEQPSPAGYTSPYQLAICYAAVGDRDTALSMLERSATRKEMQLLYLKYDPVFDGIRSDPRFLTLERRVGLLE
jgi:TolB-like protein/Tfp pilus assembly protein PilF